MKILLISGHGAGDSGAVGCGCKEADLTRELVNLIAPKLRAYATVDIYDQSRNAFKDCKTGKFNIGKYDYVFEVHFNASNGAGKGTECFVTTSEKGIKVEQAIMRRMGQFFKLRDNDSIFDGVKRTNFLVIKTCKNRGMSGALLETCFIDNKDDMSVFQSRKVEIATNIAEAMAEGFGLKKGTTPPPQTQQPSKPSKPTGTVLNVDGKHGPATTKRKQQIYGTKQDGVISGQPTVNKKYCYALDKGGCVRWTTGNPSGSDMARAEQKDLFVKGYYQDVIDGYIGKQHVEAKQRFLKDKGFYSGAIDGSYGPETCKADQRWMNSL